MTLTLNRTTWTRARFDEIALNVTDRVDDPSAAGVDRYVGLEHLDPGSMTLNRWGSPEEVAAQKLRFQPGDVIFGRRRAYQKKVAQADFEGICSAHALVLRAKTSVVSPEFLAVFLSSDYFLERAISISVGSLSPTVNWRDLARQEFDLPPLDEQHRIAHLLWATVAEIDAASRLESSLSTIREVLVEASFVAPPGARSNTLGDYCDSDGIRVGPFGSLLHASDYTSAGGVPVIMPQDMVDSRISRAQISRVRPAKAEEMVSHMVRPGDILLPRRGELDRRALVSEDEAGWICGTGSIRVRLKRDVSVKAVLLALSSQAVVGWLKANASGTTMPNLNVAIVARAPVHIPEGPELAASLGRIALVDEALRKTRRRLDQSRSLRAELLSRVFGGVE